MTAGASPELPVSAPQETTVRWAGDALVLTAVVGIVSKTMGVLVAPGIRGVASQNVVEWVETGSAALAYTFTALLVALVCGASFELARAQRVSLAARGIVVAVSGLIVALASPAVVMRLQPAPALALGVVTSIVVLVAGIATVRTAHTRVLGAILIMLSVAGVLRPFAWEAIAIAADRSSMTAYNVARALGTIAVVIQTLATLVAAAWLGTRSKWRGRILANGAVILAFVVTYLAARDADVAPPATIAVLRASLARGTASALPYGISAIAQFLTPASVLLASVALLQKAQPKAVLVSLALALLSHGVFDVPLQALAITAAAQWSLLAMADGRAMWAAFAREKDKSGPGPASASDTASVERPPQET